jgi:hypothetical protein
MREALSCPWIVLTLPVFRVLLANIFSRFALEPPLSQGLERLDLGLGEPCHLLIILTLRV